MSNRDPPAAIISMAQHARPNPIGQSEFFRAQASTVSRFVVMMLSANRWSITPMSATSLRGQQPTYFW